MIKVYSMKNCKYCEQAKDYLKEKGVPFEEINLSDKKNSEARKYYRSLGINIAPIITEDSWIIYGFNEEKKKNIDMHIREL
jgi:glutaredoxin